MKLIFKILTDFFTFFLFFFFFFFFSIFSHEPPFRFYFSYIFFLCSFFLSSLLISSSDFTKNSLNPFINSEIPRCKFSQNFPSDLVGFG
ncbi:MAG: hypothetical protein CEE42_03505 [Promethearchaeota archaeon Loki_b31]|nr:MAG: hypothetical protein CEE42_03505 [Candidatus Lokiarchaeota archaeon Loki_b31]